MITQNQYDGYHKIVHDFINKKCIIKQNNIPGKLPGTSYGWIFYLRNALFDPNISSFISEMMLYKLYNETGGYNFQICGAETAGTPLAVSLPLIARTNGIPISSFVIRKDQKTYGLKNWHEGIYSPNIPYVLVDDLCNSSTSLRHAYNICQNQLGLVSSGLAIVVVNKVNKGVHEYQRTISDMYLPKTIKVLSLFDLDSFDLSNPSH